MRRSTATRAPSGGPAASSLPTSSGSQVDLETPVHGGTLTVQFERRSQAAQVTRVRVRVRADAGSSAEVHDVPESGLLEAPLPDDSIESVRVSVRRGHR